MLAGKAPFQSPVGIGDDIARDFHENHFRPETAAGRDDLFQIRANFLATAALNIIIATEFHDNDLGIGGGQRRAIVAAPSLVVVPGWPKFTTGIETSLASTSGKPPRGEPMDVMLSPRQTTGR